MEMLKPYLPPEQGESLISWLNRFGRFHCGLAFEEFLRLVGVGQQDLNMGRPEVFDRVSAISGLPLRDLKSRSYEYVSDRLFKYNGETFFREFLLRSQVTFCPACLLTDLRESSGGMPMGIGRTSWAFRSTRTCERHETALYRKHRLDGVGLELNVTAHAPDQRSLEELGRSAVARKPSALQNYVTARFEGRKEMSWLDAQQIDLASRATELLGACVEYGAHVSLPKLTEDDWDRAGQVGFEFTSKGEEGIRQGLEYLYRQPQKNAVQCGPQGTFGRLFQWVQFRKSDKPVGPIKDVLSEFILDTFPIETGTDLFGEVIKQRRRHSVATLSASLGVHAKTVANALSQSGMLPNDAYLENSRQTVPAEPAEELIAKLKRAIPVAKIPEYIGCTRSQASLLLEVGMLQTVIEDTGNRTARHKGVDVEDLDQLIERMRQAGKSVEVPSEGVMELGRVSKALNVPSMEVLSLLLEGQIANVELLPQELKFRSVLVDVQEVAHKIGGKTGKSGMTVSATSKVLGVGAETVHFLLKAADGSSQSVLEVSGQVRHMGTMRNLVDRVSVERFKERYRKLSLIDGFWAGDPSRLRAELQGRGIQPVWASTVANAEFYRIADL